eukprot:TRINITY_DN739_c0_g1_i6.p4 TRINITY_DN739_c0_g1~~TRINITY_DN739_c0_g1_i6.p4  ORF type:complete len:102 (-),score=2.32 TRINITY_DN739_c0_g1_i6:1405-1710(-)
MPLLLPRRRSGASYVMTLVLQKKTNKRQRKKIFAAAAKRTGLRKYEGENDKHNAARNHLYNCRDNTHTRTHKRTLAEETQLGEPRHVGESFGSATLEGREG